MPFYYIGLFSAVALTVSQYGYTDQWLKMGPENAQLSGDWWQCYSYFMGLWVMIMFTWDYAHFGKIKEITYLSNINLGIPFYLCTYLLNGVTGIFLVATIPTEESLSGLLFIWVSQTRIHTANFQLATVNLPAFIYRVFKLKLSKIVVAILVGAVVFGLMLTDVFSFILLALAYQSIFVVSWVVMALTYIFINKNKEAYDEETIQASLQQPNVKYAGVLAWSISSVTGVLMLNSSSEVSQYASLATIIIAVTTYSLLQGIRNKAGIISKEVEYVED